jgi:hypothetical protein
MSSSAEYRLKAQQCFSIACTTNDPSMGQQLLDWGLYWFRLAEQAEKRARLRQSSIIG